MPVVIDGNYADFVGTGSRGRQFEIILADDDTDDDLCMPFTPCPPTTERTFDDTQDRSHQDPFRQEHHRRDSRRR
jgi:hypothetical protein